MTQTKFRSLGVDYFVICRNLVSQPGLELKKAKVRIHDGTLNFDILKSSTPSLVLEKRRAKVRLHNRDSN